MRKIYIFFALCSLHFANAQVIPFPDANLKAKLLQSNVAFDAEMNSLTLDANGNGEIEVSEVQMVQQLQLQSSNLSDLTGISFFIALKYLNCAQNQLTTLVIHDAIELWHLDASHNQLTAIAVNFASISESGVNLSHNNLTTYSIPDGNFYETFNLSHNALTTLTIANATFEDIDLSYNNLTAITVAGAAYISSSANFTHNEFSLMDLSDVEFGNESTLYLGDNAVDDVLFGMSPGNIYYTSNNTELNLGNYNRTTDCDPENQGNVTIINCPNLTNVLFKNG